MLRRTTPLLACAAAAVAVVIGSTPFHARTAPLADAGVGLPRYEPRLDRPRAIVAVVGENAYTELTDYVIPYSVLTEASVAEVIAVATQTGPIRMFPALTLEPGLHFGVKF